MFKLKYWVKENNLKKVAFITFLIFVLLSISILMIISLFFSDDVNIYAYNRDSNSGTREAFNTSIGFDPETDKYSENVFEVNGNDAMFSRVQKTKNSIGYVSLDTLYDENNQVTRDGIIPLGTRNVKDPTQIEDNIENYEAKRPFNVFFRVPKETSAYLHLTDNLYINSLNASSSNTQANIWDSNFVVPTEWGLPQDIYQVNSDYEAKFAVSYLFFNWLFYSNDARDLMTMEYNPLNNDTFDYFDVHPTTGEDVVQNYIDNTGLYDYFVSSNHDANNRLEITTQGSTSVVSLLNLLMLDEDEGFINMCESYGLYISHEEIHLGSGDAFKNNSPNSNEVFLGFQSRGFETEEITNPDWGYESSEVENFDANVDNSDFTVSSLDGEAENGFYNPLALYENDSDLLYGSFYTDAIVFIINDEIESNIGLTADNIQWIDVEGVYDIYTQNVTFDYLWEQGLIGGI